LNGLMIRGCQSFKTVKNDFVSQAPFDFWILTIIKLQLSRPTPFNISQN
jgi:hypothetical protein